MWMTAKYDALNPLALKEADCRGRAIAGVSRSP